MMVSKLAAINSSWNIQRHDSVEQALHNLEGTIEVVVLGDNFVSGNNLIRQQNANVMIIVLCSDDMESNPRADLIWSEDTSIDRMAEDLRHHVMSGALQGRVALLAYLSAPPYQTIHSSSRHANLTEDARLHIHASSGMPQASSSASGWSSSAFTITSPIAGDTLGDTARALGGPVAGSRTRHMNLAAMDALAQKGKRETRQAP